MVFRLLLLQTQLQFLASVFHILCAGLSGTIHESELLDHRVFQRSLLLSIATLHSQVIIPVCTLTSSG